MQPSEKITAGASTHGVIDPIGQCEKLIANTRGCKREVEEEEEEEVTSCTQQMPYFKGGRVDELARGYLGERLVENVNRALENTEDTHGLYPRCVSRSTICNGAEYTAVCCGAYLPRKGRMHTLSLRYRDQLSCGTFVRMLLTILRPMLAPVIRLGIVVQIGD